MYEYHISLKVKLKKRISLIEIVKQSLYRGGSIPISGIEAMDYMIRRSERVEITGIAGRRIKKTEVIKR